MGPGKTLCRLPHLPFAKASCCLHVPETLLVMNDIADKGPLHPSLILKSNRMHLAVRNKARLEKSHRRRSSGATRTPPNLPWLSSELTTHWRRRAGFRRVWWKAQILKDELLWVMHCHFALLFWLVRHSGQSYLWR